MKFVFNVEAVPKGRPRFFRGHAVTPASTRKFEALIASLVASQFRSLPSYNAMRVEIKFFILKPKSSKRTHPTVRPDVDNLSKSLLDACNGLLWHDDGQVCTLVASKEYVLAKENVRIELTVDEL